MGCWSLGPGDRVGAVDEVPPGAGGPRPPGHAGVERHEAIRGHAEVGHKLHQQLVAVGHDGSVERKRKKAREEEERRRKGGGERRGEEKGRRRGKRKEGRRKEENKTDHRIE